MCNALLPVGANATLCLEFFFIPNWRSIKSTHNRIFQMYNDFKILSENNTDELIFYKMIGKKKMKEKIHYIYLVKNKKKIKRKILHNQLTVLFSST